MALCHYAFSAASETFLKADAFCIKHVHRGLSQRAPEAADANALIEVDLPIERTLPFIVQMISAHVIWDFGLRRVRVSIGEAEKFPALAKEY